MMMINTCGTDVFAVCTGHGHWSACVHAASLGCHVCAGIQRPCCVIGPCCIGLCKCLLWCWQRWTQLQCPQLGTQHLTLCILEAVVSDVEYPWLLGRCNNRVAGCEGEHGGDWMLPRPHWKCFFPTWAALLIWFRLAKGGDAKVFVGREVEEHGVWCLGLHAFLPQACVSPGLGRPHRELMEVHAQVGPWSCLRLFLFETGDVGCVCPHVSCQSYSPFKHRPVLGGASRWGGRATPCWIPAKIPGGQGQGYVP